MRPMLERIDHTVRLVTVGARVRVGVGVGIRVRVKVEVRVRVGVRVRVRFRIPIRWFHIFIRGEEPEATALLLTTHAFSLLRAGQDGRGLWHSQPRAALQREGVRARGGRGRGRSLP